MRAYFSANVRFFELKVECIVFGLYFCEKVVNFFRRGVFLSTLGQLFLENLSKKKFFFRVLIFYLSCFFLVEYNFHQLETQVTEENKFKENLQKYARTQKEAIIDVLKSSFLKT